MLHVSVHAHASAPAHTTGVHCVDLVPRIRADAGARGGLEYGVSCERLRLLELGLGDVACRHARGSVRDVSAVGEGEGGERGDDGQGEEEGRCAHAGGRFWSGLGGL